VAKFPVFFCAIEDFAEHLAVGGNEALTEEGEESGGVRFFGEDGADEGHAVGAHERAAEVLEGSVT
jgi:hypothetical protein